MTNLDIRRIREKTSLSQARFAEKYGFCLDAIQNWEQGWRVPERYARILPPITNNSLSTFSGAAAGNSAGGAAKSCCGNGSFLRNAPRFFRSVG